MSYYSEGNLVVRTDSYDDLEKAIFNDIGRVKAEEVKNKEEEEEEELYLWKGKVARGLNNEKNLTKENFPSLR